jgi:hypothetical protein
MASAFQAGLASPFYRYLQNEVEIFVQSGVDRRAFKNAPEIRIFLNFQATQATFYELSPANADFACFCTKLQKAVILAFAGDNS